ncbi:hypothetical protein B0H10DRAFT_1833982 [Mycena sp. CBHHK59/15]|nr:hypothetical protein B0H10DRAFT_1833982 [Mycena sp. CBHHK59/15]
MLRWLLSLFSSPRVAPPPPGMRIIPCSALDVGTARELVLTFGLVIDARLDAKKLEETLFLLVERKFPRAGSRLAFRNGVYEFQMPESFDAKTPPVIFTVEDYPEQYKSSGRPEIPSALTGSPGQPCIIPPPELDAYLRNKACPKSLEELLQPNMPLLHVHLAVFDDLTFIGVTAPHIAFDAVGTATVLAAWARLLNGEAIDTVPGMEWDSEPFASFVEPNSVKAKPKRGWFDLGWFSQLSFIVRFIMRIMSDPKEVGYLVRVPKAFLQEEKQKIMGELKVQGSSEYVGSSDVLNAWWFKMVYSHRPRTDKTPMHIHIVNNLRGRPIFAGDAPLTTPYIHNAVLGIPVPPIPVSAFQTESLGALALRLRRAILAYNADPAGVRADLHWLFQGANQFKTLFPCPPGAEFSVAGSWRVARFTELDFSGACVRGKTKAARVVFVPTVVTTGKSVPMRGSGNMLMEDEHVLWMGQYRGAKEWEKIRQSGAIVFA